MNKYLKKVMKYVAPRRYPGQPVLGKNAREKHLDIETLIDQHFSSYSSPDHVCRQSLAMALNLLKQRPAVILETGSSAWGTNSSMLFDSYVNSFGGSFCSVDIRPEPSVDLGAVCTNNSKFYCDDSVRFLENYSRSGSKVDFVYLDSWDVDWEDPVPSAVHGLKEFLAIYPALNNNAILLIDDTPVDGEIMGRVHPGQMEGFNQSRKNFRFTPGKGTLVKNFLQANGIGRQIFHDYQLLWLMD
ncbi:MAG: hypothetical protein ACT4NV_02305 [Rhodoferax sp.]